MLNFTQKTTNHIYFQLHSFLHDEREPIFKDKIMIDYDEKRDYIRMDVDCDMTYKLIDSDVIKTGRCISLSGSGIAFIAETQFELGLALEVNILPMNGVTPTMTAFIEVIRSLPKADKLFETAAKIKSLK